MSTIKKDDELAKLAASAKTVKDGELSVGMELSYAPAEFYAEDGKTPVGYDVDMSKAIAQTLGLKPKIVSSMFDTIVPSIGSKYDLGITAMTITEERLQSVDFVSYYRAGSTWAVQKGQPEEARHLRHVRREDRSADRHRPGGRGQQDRQGLQGRQEGRSDVLQASGRSRHRQWPPVRADVFYADSGRSPADRISQHRRPA